MKYLLFANPVSGVPFIKKLKKYPPSVVVTKLNNVDNWKRIVFRFLRRKYLVEDYLRFFKKIEFYDYYSLSSKRINRIIEKHHIEIGFITTFSYIIKPDIYNLFPKGVYNFHPSILPEHGGPNPIYWVLKNKDKYTGTTCHQITEKLDTGDILLQFKFPVGKMNNKKLFSKYVMDVTFMIPEILTDFDNIYAKRKKAIQAVYDKQINIQNFK